MQRSINNYFKPCTDTTTNSGSSNPYPRYPSAPIFREANNVAKATEELHQKQSFGKRPRGPYQILSPEYKAKVGRYAAENGNAAAARKFSVELNKNLPESTIRQHKKHYYKQLKIQGSPDRVKTLPDGNRSRPLLLGSKLDDELAIYVQHLRSQGCPVNRTIVN